ncbi:MAG: PTS galactosamine transporter subunit IIB [Erysipelotrichaceae bacterium]|nr:PTS galactosamine transporter subunit IIB [Erysipelotrichaceae bacterium]MDY5252966.1 PTS galactosamine transporter subunit IIB [Erysipelotrichaceae bacterium]
MPNILLTRIDNRLVHGQVGVTWTKTIGANLLVVANDEASTDTLQQQLMTVTAKSSGAGIRFFSVEKTISIIGNAAPNQKIFIICKTPHDVRRLVDGGIELKDVNVGNMHFSEGKRQISKKVYVDDQDMEDLRYLASKGINVYIQDVPGESKQKID